jgi:hypothetical protein
LLSGDFIKEIIFVAVRICNAAGKIPPIERDMGKKKV